MFDLYNNKKKVCQKVTQISLLQEGGVAESRVVGVLHS